MHGSASRAQRLQPNSAGNSGGMTFILAKAQVNADRLLVRSDNGLNPAAGVVAEHLLPSHPTVLSNALTWVRGC